MNWRIRRLRLEAVGPSDARYDDITLSFVAGGRAAENGVVLLRNGGGKSLLLYLLFDALLPRHNDGTKTPEQKRQARPVVQADECATVAVEWEHRDDGRLLITGHSFERGQGEHSRWIFEPLEGALTLDELPLRDGTRRRTRAGLVTTLDELGRRHSRLRFRVVPGVGAWEQELAGVGINPQILRYQARLNRSEGGDDEELRFDGPEAFVRFVLQMVLDEERLAALQKGVEDHAEQLSRREALGVEADFCRDAAGLLKALAHANEEVERTGAVRLQAQADVRGLAGVLAAATDDCRSRIEQLRARREPLEQGRRDLETRERDLRREGNVLRTRTDELAVAVAERDLQGAEEQVRATQREDEAWRLVDALVALGQAKGQLAQLQDQVGREERGIEVAGRQLVTAAEALAAALLHAADALEVQVEQLQTRADESVKEQERLTEDLDALATRQGQLQQQRGSLESELSLFERATARLRAGGVLGARERPSAAVARLDGEREDLIARAHDLTVDAAGVAEQHEVLKRRRDELAAVEQEHRASADGLDAARARAVLRVARTLNAPVQDALDVGPDHSPLEDPETGLAAVARARASADARRASAANEIDALSADERSLTDDELLAVEPDVERVCRALDALGVEAFPALRYIGSAAAEPARTELIAARPGLAAGVVVLDADPHQAVRALQEAGTRPPRRPLVIARGRSAIDADTGAVDAVVMPSTAAYDRSAAQDALRAVAEALEQLRAREGSEAQLSSDLSRMALTLRDEVERLRELLPPASHEERRLLTAVGRQLQHHRTTASEIDGRIKQVVTAIAEAVQRAQEIAERLEQLRARREQVDLAAERLSALDDIDLSAGRERLASLDATLGQLALDSVAVRAQRDGHIRSGEGLREQLCAVQARQRTLRDDASALPTPSTPPPAQGDLPALRRGFETAQALAESQISDPELRARFTSAQAYVGRLTSEVEAADDLVAERARQIAASEIGLDAQARARERPVAHTRYEEALRAAGQVQAAHRQAKARMTASRQAVSAEDFARQPKVLGSLIPADAEEGRALLQRVDRLKAECEQAAEENKVHRAAVDEQIAAEEQLLSELVTCRRRLGGDEQPIDGPLPAWTRRRERVFDETAAASEALASAEAQHITARERMRERLEAITDAVARADERVPAGITSALRAGEALAPEAGRLDAELRTRAGELERTLAELERHRAAIIAQLSAIASESVRKLDRVAAATTLPRDEALGAWAGKQFARVHHKVIADEAARDHQLGRLLDAAVRASSRRRGLDLAFGATLALCQERIAVSVLKPHPQPDGEYHPIEVVGPEFSGGEELTIKLVLFCAVSAVRTAERSGRSRGRRRTGPLLIDNPIGTASRASLVDLQLRLARQLDAQFIPFTGLEGELHVTGRFATCVALTNDKDLLSGMRFVKHADEDLRRRLVPERPADTPEGTALVSAISYAPTIDVSALADDARKR